MPSGVFEVVKTVKESMGERKVKTSAVEALASHGWLLDAGPPRVDRLVCDGVEVDCVRDDLLHPWAGGNKLRKLDALLPRVLSRSRSRVIVTCGGAQSAHSAAVAVLCAERGAACHVLSRGEPRDVLVGYALMTRTFAASVRHVTRDEYAEREELMASWAEELGAQVIPEGGARVEAVHGLVRLVDGLRQVWGDAPRTLVVDSGTGTTAAGMAIACAWLGLEWEVEGVMLLDPARGGFEETSRKLLTEWEALHGVLGTRPPLRWVPRPTRRRFGDARQGDVRECLRIARQTGVVFDPIYTLEAWRHVVAMAPGRRERAAIVHTGGALHLAGAAQRWPRWFAQGR